MNRYKYRLLPIGIYTNYCYGTGLQPVVSYKGGQHMMRSFASTIVTLFSSVAFSQSTGSTPAFQVADIHKSPRTIQKFMRGGFLRGDRYEIRNASMVDLIHTA